METAIATKKENKVITLDQVQVRNLPELQGWKEKQHAIVKQHPYVAIEDYKTYEEAKKNRTALVRARTSIQDQDKLIAKKLKELRTESGNVASELIEITQPHEDKQQEEVKRYEAIKEQEKLEKEREEQKRKEAIQKDIVAFFQLWKGEIQNVEFSGLEKLTEDLHVAIEEKQEDEMEEFEMDFAEKVRVLEDQLKERGQYLQEQEEARKERERLAKEREAFQKEQEAVRAKAAKEEAERKERETKERAAREEEERKLRAEREAEAEKMRKEREELEAEKRAIEAEKRAKEEAERKAIEEAKAKAQKEAEEKRLKALQPDKEKLTAIINSIGIHQEAPELKNTDAKTFYTKLKLDVEELKESLTNQLSQLK